MSVYVVPGHRYATKQCVVTLQTEAECEAGRVKGGFSRRRGFRGVCEHGYQYSYNYRGECTFSPAGKSRHNWMDLLADLTVDAPARPVQNTFELMQTLLADTDKNADGVTYVFKPAFTGLEFTTVKQPVTPGVKGAALLNYAVDKNILDAAGFTRKPVKLVAAMDAAAGAQQTRLQQFDAAAVKVTADRGKVYGHPKDGFGRASKIEAVVAECKDPRVRHVLYMLATKMARLIETPDHLDSWIDIAGYARTGVMVTEPERDQPMTLAEFKKAVGYGEGTRPVLQKKAAE